jgi:arginyl-tRNA synthetase
MLITRLIQESVQSAVSALYDIHIAAETINIAPTRKEFEGDFTVVVFPFTKASKKNPLQTGEEIGQYLTKNVSQLARFNVIQGFLNLVVADSYWLQFLADAAQNPTFGTAPRNGKRVMVEFCSPNTNKPLHLGHIRNILLGWSVSKILDAAGYDVVKVKVVNDRGVAICKSMLAWQTYGKGKTPENSGTKGDHLVGDFYVEFENRFKKEYTKWQTTLKGKAIYAQNAAKQPDEVAFFKDYKNTYFNQYSKLGAATREMLLAWEANDPAVREVWKRMNGWVEAGFNITYDKLGIGFDKRYYESNTYVLGKDAIEKGLSDGVFYQKADTSIWIDLEKEKLDHKLVLRSDGTSVYITQDIGMAQMRAHEFNPDKVVYVVGDEQNYHFQVLFSILKKLGEKYADGLFHLSYGMVELPTGKMKSREGTVVDADDLIAEVIKEAAENAKERGELDDISLEERTETIRKIGTAALKFFMIKVNPKKKMMFDPKESVDMQGQTGPYIQNAYVRIQSILRKAKQETQLANLDFTDYAVQTAEKDLIAQLYTFPALVQTAAEQYDPSLIANFCYDLAKSFHKFYHDFQILRAESEAAKHFRLTLCGTLANVLHTGMGLLGIEMPERM